MGLIQGIRKWIEESNKEKALLEKGELIFYTGGNLKGDEEPLVKQGYERACLRKLKTKAEIERTKDKILLETEKAKLAKINEIKEKKQSAELGGMFK